MKFGARDLRRLSLPLLLAVLMSVIGLCIAYFTARDAQNAAGKREAAERARRQIEQRLSQVRTEEEDLKQRATLFQQLEKRGIIGDEKRLDWTELLAETQRELRIPGLKYEFGAQMPVDAGNGTPYSWFASPAKLQLRLLHEEDLLRFLERIQGSAKAMVLVRSCKVAPLARTGDNREAFAQFVADCEMQWLTLRPTGKAK